MSLASAAALLKTALLLLTLAQSSPNLPQSFKDHAIDVANQAITQASATLGTQGVSVATTTADSTIHSAPVPPAAISIGADTSEQCYALIHSYSGIVIREQSSLKNWSDFRTGIYAATLQPTHSFSTIYGDLVNYYSQSAGGITATMNAGNNFASSTLNQGTLTSLSSHLASLGAVMKKFVNKTIEQYQLLSQASRSDANTIVASSAASDAAEAADVAAQADASNVQNDAAALSSDFNAQWQSSNSAHLRLK